MKALGSIDEAAVAAFGAAIKESPPWKIFEAANQRFETDPELQRLMDQFRELSVLLRKARNEGGRLSEEEMAVLSRTQEAIQNHEAFVKRQEAYQDLVAAFRAANESLAERLGVDFARLASPAGGGCCG